MQQQSLLPAVDAAPQPTDRLIYAVYLETSVATRVARLAQTLRNENGLNGTPLAAERLHITLHHLGDYAGVPRDIVVAATKAGEMVTSPPIEISFDHAMSFSGRRDKRPFVLRGTDGLTALIAFQSALGQAMCKTGLARWVNPNATPHVTLLYDDKIVAQQAIEEVRWTAREFVLVHSLLGKTQHVRLASWPLSLGNDTRLS